MYQIWEFASGQQKAEKQQPLFTTPINQQADTGRPAYRVRKEQAGNYCFYEQEYEALMPSDHTAISLKSGKKCFMAYTLRM